MPSASSPEIRRWSRIDGTNTDVQIRDRDLHQRMLHAIHPSSDRVSKLEKRASFLYLFAELSGGCAANLLKPVPVAIPRTLPPSFCRAVNCAEVDACPTHAGVVPLAKDPAARVKSRMEGFVGDQTHF